jgi:hypothetical protein
VELQEGSPACLSGLLSRLCFASKETASFWRSETKKRCEKTDSAVYRFPALPSPIKEDWERMQNLHPLVLHFSKAYRSLETQRKWEKSMHELSAAAEEDEVAEAPPNYQIQSLHARILAKKCALQLPPRTSLSHIIMPSTPYLDLILGQGS